MSVSLSGVLGCVHLEALAYPELTIHHDLLEYVSSQTVLTTCPLVVFLGEQYTMTC
jgi:hypothetical protein